MGARRVRRAWVATAIAAGCTVVAGGVVAATQSSDEAALAPTRTPAAASIERRVDDLLRRMTLAEKAK